MIMTMTINEGLVKYNLISQVPLATKDGSLSKETKIKVMDMRITLGKIKKSFDEDVQEFISGVKTEEFDTLQNKQDRTEEENARLNEVINELNDSIITYEAQKKAEEIEFDKSLTTAEFNEIVGIMTDDVKINNQTIPATEFLEILEQVFVA
jgi:hypothetical protein